MSRKPTPRWHPISALPLFASMAQEGLEGAMEQYAALQAAAPTPYVLDDYTVNRVLEVYTAQRDDLWVFEEQLQRWLREPLSVAQRTEVERLVTTLATMKQTVGQILALAEELKHGTIDTILGMSEEDVAHAVLSGKVPDPLQRRNSPPPSALPTLTVNANFIEAFLSAPAPCCALGLVEVEGRECGLLALRPDRSIPSHSTDRGFRFGHSILGTDSYEVVHFAFEFYGFATYHVLINPSNPLAQSVLNTMVTTGDYFFFALDADQHVTAFRSALGEDTLIFLKAHLPRLQQSQTTEAQYRQAVSLFAKQPTPPGTLLQWVCRDKVAYLDLSKDRLDLTPR